MHVPRAALYLALASAARAVLFLPKICSSYMVLQGHATYDQRPFINGYAAPGDVVTVERKQPNGGLDTYFATADAEGAWITQLDPDYFAPPQNDLVISIWASSDPKDVRVLEHVVYGDVFLCSGQRCVSLRDSGRGHPLPRSPSAPPPLPPQTQQHERERVRLV